MTSNIGYKIFRIRKDGTLGPLFIDRKFVFKIGEWHDCRTDIIPKQLKTRPGWHICSKQHAPHIKLNPKNEKRGWFKVEFKEFYEMHRPECQGGKWFVANKMKVIGSVEK